MTHMRQNDRKHIKGSETWPPYRPPPQEMEIRNNNSWSAGLWEARALEYWVGGEEIIEIMRHRMWTDNEGVKVKKTNENWWFDRSTKEDLAAKQQQGINRIAHEFLIDVDEDFSYSNIWFEGNRYTDTREIENEFPIATDGILTRKIIGRVRFPRGTLTQFQIHEWQTQINQAQYSVNCLNQSILFRDRDIARFDAGVVTEKHNHMRNRIEAARQRIQALIHTARTKHTEYLNPPAAPLDDLENVSPPTTPTTGIFMQDYPWICGRDPCLHEISPARYTWMKRSDRPGEKFIFLPRAGTLKEIPSQRNFMGVYDKGAIARDQIAMWKRYVGDGMSQKRIDAELGRVKNNIKKLEKNQSMQAKAQAQILKDKQKVLQRYSEMTEEILHLKRPEWTHLVPSDAMHSPMTMMGDTDEMGRLRQRIMDVEEENAYLRGCIAF